MYSFRTMWAFRDLCVHFQIFFSLEDLKHMHINFILHMHKSEYTHRPEHTQLYTKTNNKDRDTHLQIILLH